MANKALTYDSARWGFSIGSGSNQFTDVQGGIYSVLSNGYLMSSPENSGTDYYRDIARLPSSCDISDGMVNCTDDGWLSSHFTGFSSAIAL